MEGYIFRMILEIILYVFCGLNFVGMICSFFFLKNMIEEPHLSKKDKNWILDMNDLLAEDINHIYDILKKMEDKLKNE